MIAPTVAVVGGGIAGLACAVELERAGLAVEVFDKGRVPGGRVATRRFGGTTFDHGAQFAAARGASFAAVLAESGAAVWPAASTAEQARWVGRPGMAALPAHLAATLSRPPRSRRHVGSLERGADGWRVRHFDATVTAPGAVLSEGGEIAGPFDAVLVAIPAPQAANLLASIGHEFARRMAGIRYEPCWAVLAAFSQPLDLADVTQADSGPIAWMAREASRPGRAAHPERFVLHGSGGWSRERLESDEADIRQVLLAAMPVSAVPEAAMAHRWRFAKVEKALGEPCLWDREAGLGLCGDWCLGPRVEAAYDSGRAMAGAVLAH